MSHIAEYQCELEGVDKDLLKMALDAVASQLPGGMVSDTVDSVDEGDNIDSWGGSRFSRGNATNGKKIFASIRSDNLPQGVGIHIDKNGKIQYLMDVLHLAERTTNFVQNETFHRLKKQCQKEFEKIQNQLIIAYQSAAMVQVLTELGYEITESATAEDGSQFMRAVEA